MTQKIFDGVEFDYQNIDPDKYLGMTCRRCWGEGYKITLRFHKGKACVRCKARENREGHQKRKANGDSLISV